MTEADLPKNHESQADSNNQDSRAIKDDDNKGSTLLSQEDNKVTNQSSSVDPSKEILRLALKDLQEKRCRLEQEIETLEKRKQTIEKEVSTTFSGQSDSIARRVKGFQEYLAGALQDLSNSVEQLDLIAKPVIVTPSPLDQTKAKESEEEKKEEVIVASSAIADTFKPDKELILQLLGQYLQGPDYYADPWKFRRSLEPQDAEILEDWFFNMGGRGAQPSRGNRPRNVLVSAALIAILGELYGDRFQALVLASQPERLGEWRRGLQDALGLNREDFGPNSGVVLFERSEPLIERADRLEAANEVPLILIDASEQSIEIPILQFPIWLTFAATPDELYIEEELI